MKEAPRRKTPLLHPCYMAEITRLFELLNQLDEDERAFALTRARLLAGRRKPTKKNTVVRVLGKNA